LNGAEVNRKRVELFSEPRQFASLPLRNRLRSEDFVPLAIAGSQSGRPGMECSIGLTSDDQVNQNHLCTNDCAICARGFVAAAEKAVYWSARIASE
jgi:hypothetical protein